MKIEFTGNLKQTRLFINNLATDLNRTLQTSGAQIGLKAEQLAVKHIQSGDLGWHPLSQRYLNFKLANNRSEKILISSSTYIRAIQSTQLAKQIFIGIKKGVKHQEGGDLGEIASALEFGSVKRKLKARPLWRPTLKELRIWIIGSGVIEKNIKK